MDHESSWDLESQEVDIQHCQVRDDGNGGQAVLNGDQEGGVAQNGQTNEGVLLTWKDLTLKVPPGKTILKQLSGFVEPTHLLAIMGPSGSGKSSLLTTIAGRPPKNASVSGQILLNGQKASLSYGSVAAFLDQEVTLLGTLTVYETLYYSAKLRFPDSVSEQEAQRIVADAVRQVGLQDATDTRIGTWYQRGISGGERRRVSIAIELLTSPYLILLDEPTSGLDSAAAFHVIKTLKDLAEDGARTVLCSIHQPSSEVFELFDDLCLLSDGIQIYFGPLTQSGQFFERNGLRCPPMRNPSDHYLHCVNSDFDEVERTLQKSVSWKDGSRTTRTGEPSQTGLQKSASNRPTTLTVKQTVAMLSEAYSSSQERNTVDDQLSNASKLKDKKFSGRGHAGFIRQCLYLTVRSFLNMNRDLGYYWLRLCMFTVLIIGVGTIYYNLDHSFETIQSRVSGFFFFAAFLSFMAVGGFPSHIEVLKVYNTERLNGHYGVGAFVVGSTFSPLPFLFLISVSGLCVYPLMKLHGGASRIVYFVLVLFSNLVVAEYMMMAISTIISNYLVCIIFGAGAQAIFILSAGFFRLPDNMPDPFWKYPLYYADYVAMTFQGFMQNEFLGSMFEGRTPSDRRISGHFVTYDIMEAEDRSKWLNIGLQWCVSLGFRIIFFLLLKSREISFSAITDALFWGRRKSVTVNSKKLVNGGDRGGPTSPDVVADSSGSPSPALRHRF